MPSEAIATFMQIVKYVNWLDSSDSVDGSLAGHHSWPLRQRFSELGSEALRLTDWRESAILESLGCAVDDQRVVSAGWVTGDYGPERIINWTASRREQVRCVVRGQMEDLYPQAAEADPTLVLPVFQEWPPAADPLRHMPRPVSNPLSAVAYVHPVPEKEGVRERRWAAGMRSDPWFIRKVADSRRYAALLEQKEGSIPYLAEIVGAQSPDQWVEKGSVQLLSEWHAEYTRMLQLQSPLHSRSENLSQRRPR